MNKRCSQEWYQSGLRCRLEAGHGGDCLFGSKGGCRCGPNEACSRCSTPRPALNGWGHHEGCQGFDHRGPCTCAQRDALPPGSLAAHPPAPRAVGVFYGQQYAEPVPGNSYANTVDDARKAATRRPDVVNCRCLRSFAMLRPGESAECINCSRPLVHPEDEKKRETSCAHQWLLLDSKAWCPSCDKVKAPPEGVR